MSYTQALLKDSFDIGYDFLMSPRLLWIEA